MPNPIKYSTGSESLALKKGNFYIGTGDVGKGPSDTTGYYQGPSPVSGGYVIYINKDGAPGNLSYHNAPTDNDLIAFTNNLAGQSYTTANECFTYFAGQTDKLCVNRDYEGIVTDGLVLNVDAGFTPSYPKNGTTWYDVSGTNNGTLTNGPTFDTGNGGSIVFDGTNDYADNTNFTNANTSSGTICGWVYPDSNGNNDQMVINIGGTTTYGGTRVIRIYSNQWSWATYGSGNQDWNAITSVNFNTWSYVVGVWSGTSLNFYLNTVGYSATRIGVVTPVGSVFRIGISAWSTSDRPFKGKISSVQIYNRVLSSSEILQNYNAQKGRFGL